MERCVQDHSRLFARQGWLGSEQTPRELAKDNPHSLQTTGSYCKMKTTSGARGEDVVERGENERMNEGNNGGEQGQGSKPRAQSRPEAELYQGGEGKREPEMMNGQGHELSIDKRLVLERWLSR